MSSTSPTRCSSRLARPIKRALGGVPIVMTLQGEDLFLEGLPEPFRGEALALIRAQVADVDLFVAVSEYYAGFMQDYLDIPPEKMRVAPLGIAIPADLAPGAASPQTRSPSATSRGWLPRRVCTCWPRPTPSCGASWGCRRPACARPVFAAPTSRRTSTASCASWSRRAWVASSSTAGAPDRAGKFAFLQSAGRLLRAQSVSRAEGPVPSRSDGRRRARRRAGARRAPRAHRRHRWRVSSRRPGEGTPADFAHALMSVWRHPHEGAHHGRSGYANVRERFTLEQMAERVEAVYGEAAGQPVSGPVPHAIPEVRASRSRGRRRKGARSGRADAERHLEELSHAGRSLAGAGRCHARPRPRRGGRHHRAVGLRQEHAAVHRRWARAADVGLGRSARHQSLRARAGCARALPQSRGGLRVPGPLPAAAAHGAREHARADAGR